MDKTRIALLAQDLYNECFKMLDAEPDVTGMTAGRVSHHVESVFKKTMEELYCED